MGTPMSHVDFKKWQCRILCRLFPSMSHFEFKKKAMFMSLYFYYLPEVKRGKYWEVFLFQYFSLVNIWQCGIIIALTWMHSWVVKIRNTSESEFKPQHTPSPSY